MSNALIRHPALERKDLLAGAVLETLLGWRGNVAVDQFQVAEIDPAFSDTEAFCDHYGINASQTANTVIVEATRGGVSKLAVVVMVAASRADLNGLVRKSLDARRVSLAPKDVAVGQSKMEYGSITAIGLPNDWPMLVDSRVLEVPSLTMGAGLRRSKLFFPGKALADLPNVQIIENLARV